MNVRRRKENHSGERYTCSSVCLDGFDSCILASTRNAATRRLAKRTKTKRAMTSFPAEESGKTRGAIACDDAPVDWRWMVRWMELDILSWSRKDTSSDQISKSKLTGYSISLGFRSTGISPL